MAKPFDEHDLAEFTPAQLKQKIAFGGLISVALSHDNSKTGQAALAEVERQMTLLQIELDSRSEGIVIGVKTAMLQGVANG